MTKCSRFKTDKKELSKIGKISVQKYLYYAGNLIHSSVTDTDKRSTRKEEALVGGNQGI